MREVSLAPGVARTAAIASTGLLLVTPARVGGIRNGENDV